MDAVSKHTGGGSFGKVKNSWPFVKLTIEADSISMKTILQEVRMKRENIQGIVLDKIFINNRFIFDHNDPSIKKEIEFWSFSPEPVLHSLRTYGYTVTDSR